MNKKFVLSMLAALFCMSFMGTADTLARTNTKENPLVIAWKQRVRDKIVEQPDSIEGPEWELGKQPFPPLEEIRSPTPLDIPVYGCYSWCGKFKEKQRCRSRFCSHRKNIH